MVRGLNQLQARMNEAFVSGNAMLEVDLYEQIVDRKRQVMEAHARTMDPKAAKKALRFIRSASDEEIYEMNLADFVRRCA